MAEAFEHGRRLGACSISLLIQSFMIPIMPPRLWKANMSGVLAQPEAVGLVNLLIKLCYQLCAFAIVITTRKLQKVVTRNRIKRERRISQMIEEKEIEDALIAKQEQEDNLLKDAASAGAHAALLGGFAVDVKMLTYHGPLQQLDGAALPLVLTSVGAEASTADGSALLVTRWEPPERLGQRSYDEIVEHLYGLAELHHPHLLRLRHLASDGVRYGLVMERASCSLGQVLVISGISTSGGHPHEQPPPNPAAAALHTVWLRLAGEITSAITHLHGHELYHGALHPGNVLLMENRRCPLSVKLADYARWPHALAMQIEEEEGKHPDESISTYFAPEMLRTLHRYSGAPNGLSRYADADIWSVGCLIARLASALSHDDQENEIVRASLSEMSRVGGGGSPRDGAHSAISQMEHADLSLMSPAEATGLIELVQSAVHLEHDLRPPAEVVSEKLADLGSAYRGTLADLQTLHDAIGLDTTSCGHSGGSAPMRSMAGSQRNLLLDRVDDDDDEPTRATVTEALGLRAFGDWHVEDMLHARPARAAPRPAAAFGPAEDEELDEEADEEVEPTLPAYSSLAGAVASPMSAADDQPPVGLAEPLLNSPRGKKEDEEPPLASPCSERKGSTSSSPRKKPTLQWAAAPTVVADDGTSSIWPELSADGPSSVDADEDEHAAAEDDDEEDEEAEQEVFADLRRQHTRARRSRMPTPDDESYEA